MKILQLCPPHLSTLGKSKKIHFQQYYSYIRLNIFLEHSAVQRGCYGIAVRVAVISRYCTRKVLIAACFKQADW